MLMYIISEDQLMEILKYDFFFKTSFIQMKILSDNCAMVGSLVIYWLDPMLHWILPMASIG